MINQRTYTCLLCLSLSGALFLSKPAQADDYVSCLAEKLQGITHDAAEKAITEACQAQYANNTAPKPAGTPAKAVVIDGRYRDNGNGTITDSKTNLTWMRCSLGQQWTGNTCAGVAGGTKWDDALKTAMTFSYAGHSDWRVPTVEELDSLVYCSKGRKPSARPNGKYVGDTNGMCLGDNYHYQRPTIDIRAFPNTPDSWYWSSSPDAFNSNSAWSVFFDNGGIYDSLKNDDYHVRLVRAGQ